MATKYEIYNPWEKKWNNTDLQGYNDFQTQYNNVASGYKSGGWDSRVTQINEQLPVSGGVAGNTDIIPAGNIASGQQQTSSVFQGLIKSPSPEVIAQQQARRNAPGVGASVDSAPASAPPPNTAPKPFRLYLADGSYTDHATIEEVMAAGKNSIDTFGSNYNVQIHNTTTNGVLKNVNGSWQLVDTSNGQWLPPGSAGPIRPPAPPPVEPPPASVQPPPAQQGNEFPVYGPNGDKVMSYGTKAEADAAQAEINKQNPAHGAGTTYGTPGYTPNGDIARQDSIPLGNAPFEVVSADGTQRNVFSTLEDANAFAYRMKQKTGQTFNVTGPGTMTEPYNVNNVQGDYTRGFEAEQPAIDAAVRKNETTPGGGYYVSTDTGGYYSGMPANINEAMGGPPAPQTGGPSQEALAQQQARRNAPGTDAEGNPVDMNTGAAIGTDSTDPLAIAKDKLGYDYTTPYVSPWKAEMESLMNNLVPTFTFDPNTDPAYKVAFQQAAKDVLEFLNSRGIADSTISIDRIARRANELQATFYDKAYNRWMDSVNINLKKMEMYQSLDAAEYGKYKDKVEGYWKLVDATIAEQKNKIEEKNTEIKRQGDRVDSLGYVDNEASKVLGLPVGTLSKEARKRADDLIEYNKKKSIDWDYQQKENEAKKDEAVKTLTAQQEQTQQRDSTFAIELSKIAGMSTAAARTYLSKLSPQTVQILGSRMQDLVNHIISRENTAFNQGIQKQNADTAATKAARNDNKQDDVDVKKTQKENHDKFALTMKTAPIEEVWAELEKPWDGVTVSADQYLDLKKQAAKIYYDKLATGWMVQMQGNPVNRIEYLVTDPKYRTRLSYTGDGDKTYFAKLYETAYKGLEDYVKAQKRVDAKGNIIGNGKYANVDEYMKVNFPNTKYY